VVFALLRRPSLGVICGHWLGSVPVMQTPAEADAFNPAGFHHADDQWSPLWPEIGGPRVLTPLPLNQSPRLSYETFQLKLAARFQFHVLPAIRQAMPPSTLKCASAVVSWMHH